jgi:hypothetical protein
MDRINVPTENERVAQPGDYWFHTYDGYPRFLWGEWNVSEEEYRRYARAEDVAYVDDVLKKP